MDDRVIIEQLQLPTKPRDPGWDDLVAANELINASRFEMDGDHGLAMTPEGRLASLAPRPEDSRALFVARSGGATIGYALSRRMLNTETHEAFGIVGVHPSHRRRGLGTQLLSTLLDHARREGASTFQSFVVHPTTGEGPQLPVPDGNGSVPADNAAVQFALARGLRLVQANVGSELDVPLPAERLAALDAVTTVDRRYELRLWDEPTPDDLLSGVALLRTRMSTDAPSGGLAGGEDPWDEARVRADEQRRLDEGHRRVVAGAVERATGVLAGFTEINIPPGDGLPADQEYTLVLREHRGHGLGLRLKVANLRRLAEVSPDTRRVITFNADENAPMLRINDAIGFRPYTVSGAWRLDL